MTKLDMKTADAIVDGTIAAGEKRGAEPLTVAVLDEGGHVVVMKRSDGSGILRCEIASGKAWGALGMGLASRTLFERAKSAPSFIAAISAASGGRVIPVPGGVLIRSDDGSLMGAVGVSGDTSDIDEECALAGIAATGLVGDTGQS